MDSKAILFSGIASLVGGILLRRLTSFEGMGLFLILFGVMLKTMYIVTMARNGRYQPGLELIFLFTGLFIFLAGLYMRSLPDPFVNPVIPIVFGLLLKVVFIVRFIQVTRSAGKA